jgi:ABC-type antimicrobial peptide transport system permease subunit
MWMLKIGVGDTIDQPDEAGNPVKFRLVGTLIDCPLQSELFIADESFRRLYPRQEGYRVFLIDAPAGKMEKVASVLEAGLRANGLSVTPSADKVAGFQAVVGTYLTLFQLLGGFGLILGVLGLAIVLVRGVAERAGELALLRAVGFSAGSLRWLVRAETLFLLLLGLGVGLAAAAVSVAPQLATGAGLPVFRLAVVLGAVALIGVFAAMIATRWSLRVPLVPALRAE